MEVSINIEEIKEIAKSNLKCSKKFSDILKNKEDFEKSFNNYIIEINSFIDKLKSDPSSFPIHKQKMVSFSQQTDLMILQFHNKFSIIGANSQVKTILVMKLTQLLTKISGKLNDIIYLGKYVDNHTLSEIEKDILSLDEIFEKMKEVIS